MNLLNLELPGTVPVAFMPDLVPDGQIIHKGILSPDMKEYYYTISDPSFENFDVYVIRKENEQWTEPITAFFNSEFDEHGISFSPDGNTLYFSSTRPVYIVDVQPTWHIWKSDKVDGSWTDPVFVDIPNMRDKLVSHPVITNSGTLYFHSSNLDYSDMDLYHSKQVDGKFRNAEKLSISLNADKCTPYVSPDEKFLVFATIGEQLELYVSFNDGQGNWTRTKRLNDRINASGQGNPYVTPDNQLLFFTTDQDGKWQVKWVNIGSELNSD
ncbi:TolB family protein [Fulvivirga sedimenti]|uniref:Uncharacterized protein n=1 Tax=Fulvivirga sedimenti TaxID=2879465 RepID=A0A9X1HQP6_9BACT|nr:hypothetical protein [Fulvivirga sedimenti]MCA6074482.1 hypothetical protein [Fulvivirga sedimenti]MCA6075659.1 hypothetical protein [Fulvivirga sedimenti]MCA6076787.1 hypothetical protein [Fulvivirga sedimenti]